jgi:hypothetical protein
VGTDKQLERAIAIGEANRRTLELVRNWCTHLSIEKQGTGGLVEQFTDLPIGPHSLSCPHAPAAGFFGHDLQFLALDFHDRNCRGCAHRQPVGLPNLSSLVHERDQQRAAAEANAADREVAISAALAERDAKRQRVRGGLAPASADVIDQIEDIDHGREGADVDRLATTARLAPDVFTAPVLEYVFELIEAGETWFDRAGLLVLSALDIDRTRLTRYALLCIPRRFATETGADILVNNLPLADAELVELAVPSLISLANPRRLPLGGPDQPPRPGLLLCVYDAFPTAVGKAIETLLNRSTPSEVGKAARAIIALAAADASLPGRFARALTGKFVRDRQLLELDEQHHPDGETLNELREALAVTFMTAPTATDELFQAFLAGASEVAEARIFSVYREALRHLRFNEETPVTEASRLALNRIVWHAAETSSYAVLQEISHLIHGRPYGITKLAASEARSLLGAAILIEGKAQTLSATPALEDPVRNIVVNRGLRVRLLRDLRDSLVNWAATGAGQSLAATRDYLQVLAGLPSDAKDLIKIAIIRHLDRLMTTTEGLTAALPQLYTALVGNQVALRAAAAYAIGELDGRQFDNLPGLVFEAFLPLLLDPYVMVHKHAADALRRGGFRVEFRQRAKESLFALIATYGRSHDDDHFLIKCLDFYIDHFADPDEFSGRLGTWLISVLEPVKPWIIAKDILTFARALRTHHGYVPFLIRLLGDAEAWAIEHEYLSRAITELPANAVHRHLPAWSALVAGLNVQDRGLRGHLIELFTRAGAWEVAAVVARSLEDAVPQDTWNRQVRLAAGQMRVATELEAALAVGALGRVSDLRGEWQALAEAIKRDWAENAERRDLPRGLRAEN